MQHAQRDSMLERRSQQPPAALLALNLRARINKQFDNSFRLRVYDKISKRCDMGWMCL
jgi:hypothetical protein